MTEISIASRLAGGVWGHLIGDAVGVPYEFRRPEEISEVVFGAPKGTWNEPPGTWSDDGARMLALLDSLLGRAPKGPTRFDPDDQGKRALAWRREGAYTPDHEGAFDIGGTTSQGLLRLGRGTRAIDAGPADEMSSGNGSLMRILPLALVERSVDATTLVEHAHLASRLTHGHPRCQVACALYVLVARRLLEGAEPDEALEGARATLRRIYDGRAGDQSDGSDGKGAPAMPVHLAALDELEAYAWRTGGGFVLDSFWSTWDAFRGATDYRSTIERAVRYGHDTDTTAATAGGLAGIHWGWHGLPVEWRQRMRGHEIARPLVDRLVETAGAWTSLPHLLRVDQLRLDRIAGLEHGHLGITFLPGKKSNGLNAVHWRDIGTDATRLVELGVTTLFLLVEDGELESCGVPELPETISAAGVNLVRFPIADPHTPADGEAYRAAIAGLVERLRAGESIAIACRGGLDRSGTAAACTLISAGLPAEEAIARVRAGRHGALSQPEQIDYVMRWPTRA